MTPASERKAKERKAKRDAGLVPMEVWVPSDKVGVVRAFVEGLARENIDWPTQNMGRQTIDG